MCFRMEHKYSYTPEEYYARQALINQGVHEPHSMPVPSGAPWNVQRVPWGMPSPPPLVQFTANNPEERIITPVIHCKRKSLDVEPSIPAKQLITEEKMAAHLNGLHISCDYRPHSLSSDDSMDVNMDSNTTAIDKLKGHTIVLSDELKKIQEEPLLPAALIDRLEKPHMSLVVWRPRDYILEDILKDENKLETDEERSKMKEEHKRLGVLVEKEDLMNNDIIDVEM